MKEVLCSGRFNLWRITRSAIIAASDKEAVRCIQVSSRCFQGYTTNLEGTARPRLHAERSGTLMKTTGSDVCPEKNVRVKSIMATKEKVNSKDIRLYAGGNRKNETTEKRNNQ